MTPLWEAIMSRKQRSWPMPLIWGKHSVQDAKTLANASQLGQNYLQEANRLSSHLGQKFYPGLAGGQKTGQCLLYGA